MKVKSFLKLVEIQTKVASVLPFLLGTVYVLYRFNTFNTVNFFIMFVSLLSFDMATTAINNYIDFKKAVKTEGYNYESHNAIVRDKLRESTVIATIVVLLAVAVSAGIVLYLNTNIVVLLIGIVSFGVGILYTFGPLPISRMPLGEVFSGFFMGFVIPFLSVYIHIFDREIVRLGYEAQILSININAEEILYIFLVSFPAVSGIANIMLANNICDIEDDIENKRYTLPIYIGREKALTLFKALYYLIYLDIFLIVILRILPLASLVLLLTFIPVNKNIKGFFVKQTKKDTFVLAVRNFVLVSSAFVILIGALAAIKSLL